MEKATCEIKKPELKNTEYNLPRKEFADGKSNRKRRVRPARKGKESDRVCKAYKCLADRL